jgi:hypothetical protein
VLAVDPNLKIFVVTDEDGSTQLVDTGEPETRTTAICRVFNPQPRPVELVASRRSTLDTSSEFIM